MSDGREAAWVRALTTESHVIAKIERAEALTNLERICEQVDAVWICRGDLGAQIGPVPMAKWISALAVRDVRPGCLYGRAGAPTLDWSTRADAVRGVSSVRSRHSGLCGNRSLRRDSHWQRSFARRSVCGFAGPFFHLTLSEQSRRTSPVPQSRPSPSENRPGGLTILSCRPSRGAGSACGPDAL